jgi:hypothetical protein
MEVDQWTQVISSFVLSLCVVSISQKRTTNNNNNNINPLCKAARDARKKDEEETGLCLVLFSDVPVVAVSHTYFFML